ncbi:MAG: hypothetical protein DME94_04795, partial [Verrucomicrobia bacterium]
MECDVLRIAFSCLNCQSDWDTNMQKNQGYYLRLRYPLMEKALIEFSAGKVTQPVRSVIKVDVAAATGFLGLMPALTPEGLGLKAVTFYPSNAQRGIPTHMATIFLVDPETGVPLAIMDGRLITEMRTAAVSAAATKLLASR